MKLLRHYIRILLIIFISLECHAQIFQGLRVNQIACGSYSGLLKSQGYSSYWHLNETSGTTAADSIGTNSGTYNNSATMNVTGPLVSPSKGVTLNGTNQDIPTSVLQTNPTTLTLAVWFKTATGGGKLIGFGNSASGGSTSFDRHIYMSTSGQINFGVYNGSSVVITSPGTYIDNAWHMAVATFGSLGMALYIDGAIVGTNANTTVAAFNGYWRIGYDTLGAWPNSGGVERYTGSLSEVAVSQSKAMSGSEIENLYNLGSKCRSIQNLPKVVITSAIYGAGGLTCDATTYISNICNNVTTCSVTANNSMCGDPNGGVTKSLTVNYTCSGSSKSTTVTEGAGATMTCP